MAEGKLESGAKCKEKKENKRTGRNGEREIQKALAEKRKGNGRTNISGNGKKKVIVKGKIQRSVVEK